MGQEIADGAEPEATLEHAGGLGPENTIESIIESESRHDPILRRTPDTAAGSRCVARYARGVTRIIAGRARSVRLSVPSVGTRPTSERVREALFSTLDAWDAISGAHVLDLYAGSGALGLEAASRGASSVVLVERNAKAAGLCRTNAAAVQRALGPRPTPIDVSTRSVRAHLTTATPPVDLVLVDPPYDVSEQDIADDLAAIARLLSAGGVIVVERSSRSPEPTWPTGIEAIRKRAYGETTLWFAESPAPESDEAERSETSRASD